MKTQVQLKHAALRTVFIVASVVFGLRATYGQTPGGIPTNLKLWLKADAGTTISGSSVSQWNDVSGAAVSGNFTPQNVSPLVGQTAPTYSAVAVNFNPYVSFDGSTNSLASANSFLGSNMFDPNYNTICQVVRSHGLGVWFKWENTTGGTIRVGFESSVINRMRFDFPEAALSIGINTLSAVPITNVHKLATAQTDITNSTLRMDGGSPAVKNISAAGPFQGSTYTDKLIIGNNRSFNLPANIEIAEIIVFNAQLVPADLNKVESYLAIKYGFTLDQTTAQNYVASNGTIAWDAAANGVYNKDITGIGRDDGSALIQRQSRNNAGFDPVTIGTGTIAVSNVLNPNNFTNNFSFLTWGNDGNNLTFNTSAAKPTGIIDRVTVSGKPSQPITASQVPSVLKCRRSPAWELRALFVCCLTTMGTLWMRMLSAFVRPLIQPVHVLSLITLLFQQVNLILPLPTFLHQHWPPIVVRCVVVEPLC